jgi:hypothetical protein
MSLGLLVVTETLLTAWIHDTDFGFSTQSFAEDQALMTPKSQ